MQRLLLDDYPWEIVEKTQKFITGLYAGPAPSRPAALLHPALLPEESPLEPPAGLDGYALQVWGAQRGIARRPLGLDDYVPTMGTGAGTCAMATAFGCTERYTSGVYWVNPCITRMEEINTLRKPAVDAGKLGGVLEQTRAYAACADERLPIRIMDFQSPFTTVEQMLGSDTFFLMPYDEPERLHMLMDVVTDFAIDFFTAQIAAAGANCCPGCWPAFWFPHCAGIQMSDDNMVNVSPNVYDEFVVPYNNRVAEAFGGLFLHSCTITEANLPSLHKMPQLTGINCDISSSVSTARLLESFGDTIVIGPHAYINTNTNFRDYTEFTRAVLEGWHPGKRLFIHPCSVLYLPERATEIRFNMEDTCSVLEEIPSWRDSHTPYRHYSNNTQ